MAYVRVDHHDDALPPLQLLLTMLKDCMAQENYSGGVEIALKLQRHSDYTRHAELPLMSTWATTACYIASALETGIEAAGDQEAAAGDVYEAMVNGEDSGELEERNEENSASVPLPSTPSHAPAQPDMSTSMRAVAESDAQLAATLGTGRAAAAASLLLSSLAHTVSGDFGTGLTRAVAYLAMRPLDEAAQRLVSRLALAVTRVRVQGGVRDYLRTYSRNAGCHMLLHPLACPDCGAPMFQPTTDNTGVSRCGSCVEQQKARVTRRVRAQSQNSSTATTTALQAVVELAFPSLALAGSHLAQARTALRTGDYDAAGSSCTSALSTMPGLHTAYGNLSLSRFKEGRYQESLESAAAGAAVGPACWAKGHYRSAKAILALRTGGGSSAIGAHEGPGASCGAGAALSYFLRSGASTALSLLMANDRTEAAAEGQGHEVDGGLGAGFSFLQSRGQRAPARAQRGQRADGRAVGSIREGAMALGSEQGRERSGRNPVPVPMPTPMQMPSPSILQPVDPDTQAQSEKDALDCLEWCKGYLRSPAITGLDALCLLGAPGDPLDTPMSVLADDLACLLGRICDEHEHGIGGGRGGGDAAVPGPSALAVPYSLTLPTLQYSLETSIDGALDGLLRQVRAVLVGTSSSSFSATEARDDQPVELEQGEGMEVMGGGEVGDDGPLTKRARLQGKQGIENEKEGERGEEKSPWAIAGLGEAFLPGTGEDSRAVTRAQPIPRPALAEALDCLLCYSLLYQPVTVPGCQHTFCKECIIRVLDHKPECPACRADISGLLSTHTYPINMALQRIATSAFPHEYAARSVAVRCERQEMERTLAIFVCNIVLPGEDCGLHIFEPRYRLMMRRAMQSGYRRFGMSCHLNYADPREGPLIAEAMGATGVGAGPWAYSPIGCRVFIRSMTLLPDGRSHMDCVAERRRFRVKERRSRDGYNVGLVEWIDDTDEEEVALELLRGVAAERAWLSERGAGAATAGETGAGTGSGAGIGPPVCGLLHMLRSLVTIVDSYAVLLLGNGGDRALIEAFGRDRYLPSLPWPLGPGLTPEAVTQMRLSVRVGRELARMQLRSSNGLPPALPLTLHTILYAFSLSATPAWETPQPHQVLNVASMLQSYIWACVSKLPLPESTSMRALASTSLRDRMRIIMEVMAADPQGMSAQAVACAEEMCEVWRCTSAASGLPSGFVPREGLYPPLDFGVYRPFNHACVPEAGPVAWVQRLREVSQRLGFDAMSPPTEQSQDTDESLFDGHALGVGVEALQHCSLTTVRCLRVQGVSAAAKWTHTSPTGMARALDVLASMALALLRPFLPRPYFLPFVHGLEAGQEQGLQPHARTAALLNAVNMAVAAGIPILVGQ